MPAITARAHEEAPAARRPPAVQKEKRNHDPDLSGSGPLWAQAPLVAELGNGLDEVPHKDGAGRHDDVERSSSRGV
jgi:hypothetical protein